jgi:cation-transporting ATPase F
VALAVGAIPEGLPAAMTITLAIGVSRMARRRAIIRKLPAVETLGSTTVICSDKTGTLTENQMTVREIYAGGVRTTVSGSGYTPSGKIGEGHNVAGALRECLLAGVLCNDAGLSRSNRHWEVVGDPTEGALLVAARKAGLDERTLQKLFPRLDEIPFDSARQYMATLHEIEGVRLAYFKGALEQLLPRSTSMLDGNGLTVALRKEEIEVSARSMAAEGLRVLAVARLTAAGSTMSLDVTSADAGLQFVGLVGMVDPPRPKAIAAVRTCHGAGIRVKMITGDHAITALSIARQVGIAKAGEAVLTGRELAVLDDEGLRGVVRKVNVFARVEPAQKLRLVRALQANGDVVAMTGDGVNDAPALKQADIGIAMGLAGTEVAKDAADMVLTDDDFAAIEAAVEEGRGVYDNLVKFITWTLPTNFGEGLVIVAAILAGATLPITPLQILWINMTTAQQPANHRQFGVQLFGGVPIIAMPDYLAGGLEAQVRGAVDHLLPGLPPPPVQPVVEFPDQQRAVLIDDALADDEARFRELPEHVGEDALDRLHATYLVERVLEAGIDRVVFGKAADVSGLSPSKNSISAATATRLFMRDALTGQAKRRTSGK